MRITFIGLGYMGSALVRAHLKAGSHCTIWNRSPDKPIVSELQAEGATWQENLGEAIAASDFFVICLPDHESVYNCLDILNTRTDAAAALSRLKAVINLSNGTPEDSRKMSSWMKERQVSAYIAGAIMAGPDNIGDRETAFILYSGEISEGVRNDVEQLMSVLARPEFVGADVGGAQLHNNASLAATYSLFSGVLLSTAILSQAESGSERGSVPILKSFQSYVAPLLKPAVSEVDGIAEAVEQDNEDAMGSAVTMLAASVKNLTRTCDELSIDAGGMEHFWRVCDAVVKNGDGGKGMTAVAKMLLRKP